MTYAPIARIILRYLVGGVVGMELASDPDVVLGLAMAIGAAVEALYAVAKRKGWAT